MTQPEPAPVTRRGATLPEIVIGVATVAILVGLSVSGAVIHRSSPRPAQELVTVLASARARATSTGRPVVVAFDTLDGEVRVHTDDNGDGQIQVGEQIALVSVGDGLRFSAGAAPPLPSGPRGASFRRVQTEHPSLVFEPDGRALESGVVYLVPGTKTSFSPDPDDVTAVEVFASSGTAVCLRVEGGRWLPGC